MSTTTTNNNNNNETIMNSDAQPSNSINHHQVENKEEDDEDNNNDMKGYNYQEQYYDYNDPLTNHSKMAFAETIAPTNTGISNHKHYHQQQHHQETKEEVEETDESMISMMKEVNDQLETALEQSKQSVKRILKELVTFHEVSMTTLKEWKHIRDAEQQEAQRLDQLQNEVHGATAAAFPGTTVANHPNPIATTTTGIHQP